MMQSFIQDIKRHIFKGGPALTALVAALLLCILIAFAGQKFLYSKEVTPKFTIAVVDNDNTMESRLLISSFSENESLQKICNLELMDNETAKLRFKEHSAAAILEFPSGFIESIKNSSNSPLKVQLSSSDPLVSMLCISFIDAGKDLLSATQAGVYATFDAARDAGVSEDVISTKIFRGINLDFIRIALGRADIIDLNKLSATGVLTLAHYYALHALAFFSLLVLLIFYDGYMATVKGWVILRVKISGSNPVFHMLQKFLALFSIMFVFLIASTIALNFVLKTPISLLRIFTYCASITSLFMIICCIFEHRIAAMLSILVIAIFSFFLSGGILPASFLPGGLSMIAPYTLEYHFVNEGSQIFPAICTFLFLFASIFITSIKRGGERQ